MKKMFHEYFLSFLLFVKVADASLNRILNYTLPIYTETQKSLEKLKKSLQIHKSI